MQDYHQLEIWQRAMTYAVRIYELTAKLPDAEKYGLTGQLRKAATSMPLNIAEGSGCGTNAEFNRFLGYAYRSLKEVVTGPELCERLYSDSVGPGLPTAIEEGNRIARMTRALMSRLSRGS